MLSKISIYHWMILFLVIIGISGVLTLQQNAWPQLIIVPAVAGVLDFFINFVRFKSKSLPETGIITGLFCASIFTANLPFAVLAGVLAILSKHLIRWKDWHPFNPAAFGLVVAAAILGNGVEWWNTTSWIIIPLGLFIAWRIRRIYISIAFLLASWLINSAYFMMSGVAINAQALLLNYTMLFFAFFMAVEPRTTPNRKKGMVLFGISLAALLFLLGRFIPQIDPLLLSLLVMNLTTPLLNRLK